MMLALQLDQTWFGLIAFLWVGYFFLEGFDFGVGMLLPAVARDEGERTQMLATIAPVWDGNEVWLITAGASMFAAFPYWYATLFSGFYLALLLILVGLILRAVALEYRGKVDDDQWRSRWDVAIMAGSWLPAVLWGVAFANIVAGVPIDANGDFTGNLGTLLNPFALLGGVCFASAFALHGLNFLTLKTTGPVNERARTLTFPVGAVAILSGAAFLLWNQVERGKGWTWAVVVVAALGLIGSVLVQRKGRDGIAFVLTGIAIAAVAISLFGNLYPNVMPSTTDAAFDLTIANASSTPYTLRIMTWVAGLMIPFVMGYQAWSYWVFRKRITQPAARRSVAASDAEPAAS